MLATTTSSVWASDDHIEARLLRNSGEIMPLVFILKNLRMNYPGTILEIELEREDQQIIYEIDILEDKGIVKEFSINARTGEILSIKNDH